MEVGVPDDITRRDLAWVATRAFGAAAGTEFFATWLRAAQAHNTAGHSASAPPEPDRWTDYRPKFFSAVEFGMLNNYTEILIPSDDTPGAKEAHVAPFIDFLVNAAAEYAPEMQAEWRTAMTYLTEENFHALSRDRQVALIKESSEPETDHSKTHTGYPTYRLIKTAAIHAFYTSRAGLVDALEYKGLAYLTQFPACDHAGHKMV
jgi:hypothetical protein